MRGLIVLIAISLFLVGFVAAIDLALSITTGAIRNNTLSASSNQAGLSDEDDEINSAREAVKASIEVRRSNLTESQIKKIIKKENRINATAKVWECPLGCTCAGSTMKCTLASGRVMTILAGKSGNVIVQVKGENMTTNVRLYKLDKKLYGVFRNNETKVVRMLPDQVKERIRERIKARLQNENITLNENSSYDYTAQKRARLFFIFPVRVAVQAEINSETGEVMRLRATKWWAFLARDETEEPVLGGSCGTVTPGENDNCCKNKGYDVWNAQKAECDFIE